jgi:pyruvate,water dikinase
MVLWFEQLTQHDVPRVGGKNASLGEMIRELATQQVRVPGGFAVTASAYREFLAVNGFEPVLRAQLARLAEGAPLSEVGATIRAALGAGTLPPGLVAQIREAYAELGRRAGVVSTPVAVRSSATAEDLPEASFAGQQETFLNVVGIDALLEAIVQCFASLYTDRAITNRTHHGFDHLQVALSVGVQRMVRSGEFPAPIRLSPRAVGWREEEVRRFINQRAADRDAERTAPSAIHAAQGASA